MSLDPENMRSIADKIEELMIEAEKTGQQTIQEPDRKSLDDLLTSPAGAKKIADQIDKNSLVTKLKLSTHEGDDLWLGIENLSKDSPTINKENSLAILKAFQKIAPKPGSMNESYNKAFDDVVSFSAVEKAIKDASAISPMAKDIAHKLSLTLAAGSKNRNMDEGLEGVFNAVVYAINAAKAGDRSELLHMLDDFETKYEGDNYAFDQKLWNDLMKNIKGLAKEVLNRAE